MLPYTFTNDLGILLPDPLLAYNCAQKQFCYSPTCFYSEKICSPYLILQPCNFLGKFTPAYFSFKVMCFDFSIKYFPCCYCQL